MSDNKIKLNEAGLPQMQYGHEMFVGCEDLLQLVRRGDERAVEVLHRHRRIASERARR